MNLNALNKTPLRAAGGAALAVDRHEEKSNNTKADRHSRFLNSL